MDNMLHLEKITEGLEIVDKIANMPRNFQDCPNEPVIIKTIRRD